MLAHMKEASQAIFKDRSQLNVDDVASRLFHLLGSCRFLQQDPYRMMMDICHVVNPETCREIFKEWTRLMIEHMDDKPQFMYLLQSTVDVMFEYVYTASNVRDPADLISMWFLYHIENRAYRIQYPAGKYQRHHQGWRRRHKLPNRY